MAQNHPAPAPPRVLAVVRDGTEVPEPRPAPVPDGGTGTSTEPVPVPGGVVPLTVPERTRLAVTHWAGTAASGAGQMWLHPGRLVHGLYTGKPGSLAEHRVYVKSREWVPLDLDGKWAAFIAGAGIFYHLLIARPLKTAALIVSAAADRPLRLAVLAVFLLLASVLLSQYL